MTDTRSNITSGQTPLSPEVGTVRRVSFPTHRRTLAAIRNSGRVPNHHFGCCAHLADGRSDPSASSTCPRPARKSQDTPGSKNDTCKANVWPNRSDRTLGRLSRRVAPKADLDVASVPCRHGATYHIHGLYECSAGTSIAQKIDTKVTIRCFVLSGSGEPLGRTGCDRRCGPDAGPREENRRATQPRRRLKATGGKWFISRFRSRIRKNSVPRITAEFLRIQLRGNHCEVPPGRGSSSACNSSRRRARNRLPYRCGERSDRYSSTARSHWPISS